MNAKIADHPWSENALFLKAKLYAERMGKSESEPGLQGFWSSLSLEFLIRAALAHINPVLLAEMRNEWQQVAYALGLYDPTTPKSANISEVIKRLRALDSPFNQEIANFCLAHVSRRNSELHTGELAFENVGTGEWLARYFQACDILLKSMDKRLRDMFKDTTSARRLITSLDAAAVQSVNQDVADSKKRWAMFDMDRQKRLIQRAERWATRERGHRVKCPSCPADALVRGFPYGSGTREIGDEEVIEKQQMLPSTFGCMACGLRIRGIAKLSAIELGNLFTHTRTTTIAEYFDLYTEEELEEARNELPDWGYDDDFNEY